MNIAKSGGASVVKFDNLLMSVGSENIRTRARAAVRPGIEVLLLAAVALGCAQAGWSVLTPSNAGAFDTPHDGEGETNHITMEVVSPFEPSVLDGDQQSQAVAALLSGVQLSGVRRASDPMLSGAVLTLNDGAQRAFAVGQEVSAGVSLEEIGADYVLLSYAGGQRRIAMSAGPSYSFARAMMGLEPAPDAPPRLSDAAMAEHAAAVAAQSAAVAAPEAATFATPAVVAASEVQTATASAADVAWLQATLSQVDQQNDQVRGWRVAEPMPQAAVQAGLQSGDVIVSVNGAGPESGASVLLAAAQSQNVQLNISRGDERLTLTLGIHL